MTMTLKLINLPQIFHNNILEKCSVNHIHIKGITKVASIQHPLTILSKNTCSQTPRSDKSITYYQNKSNGTNTTHKIHRPKCPNYLNRQTAMQLGTCLKYLSKPWNTRHICTTNVRLPNHAADLRTRSGHHAHTTPLNTNVYHRPCISRTKCTFICSGDRAVAYITPITLQNDTKNTLRYD
jgi:hypothetical protein